MASKNDILPLSITKENDSTGTITYANEVIAIIAGVAANEVEGIAGMCSGGGFSDVFIRSRNIRKGVKVEIGAEEASVDLYVIVEYGTPIQIAAQDVQDSVRKAIETMTGLHVVKVDVHVNGVSFEKEKLEEEAGLENAMLSDTPAPALEEKEEKSKPAAGMKNKAKAAPEAAKDDKPAETQNKKPVETEDKKPAETQDTKPAATAAKKPARTRGKKPTAARSKKPAATENKKPAAKKQEPKKDTEA